MFTPFNDASYFGTKTRVTMSEADNISSPLERPGRGHLAWDIEHFAPYPVDNSSRSKAQPFDNI
jgi:hypothetical protein